MIYWFTTICSNSITMSISSYSRRRSEHNLIRRLIILIRSFVSHCVLIVEIFRKAYVTSRVSLVLNLFQTQSWRFLESQTQWFFPCNGLLIFFSTRLCVDSRDFSLHLVLCYKLQQQSWPLESFPTNFGSATQKVFLTFISTGIKLRLIAGARL